MLYFGQHVGMVHIEPARTVTIGSLFEHDYLLLRPLSSITEEEKHHAYKISFYGMTDHEKIRASVEYADIIRSKGFALPFMGISVEEMVAAGWIKLIEQND